MNHDRIQPSPGPTSFWRSRYAVGLLGFGAIAAYFLLSEHRAHFLGALPLVLLFSCLFMHVFMHHGHAGHGGGHVHGDDDGGPATPDTRTSTTGDQP